MPDWTFHADTPPAADAGEAVAERLLDLLEADPLALGPVTAVNLAEKTVGATFTVDADTPVEAVEVGSALFTRAIRAAGLQEGAPGHVEASLAA